MDSDFFANLLSLEFQKTGTLVSDAKDVLEYLKEYCKLIIITNSPKNEQYPRLQNAHILDYFFKIFISEEIGYSKPDKNFFEVVFNSICDIAKSDILIVGDSISADILGGKNSGIDTCWYNPKRKVKRLNIEPTYEIESLKEVIDIVNS